MARRYSIPRARGSRRATSWQNIDSSTTNLVTIGGTIVNSGSTALLAKRPFTVIRTHLLVQISSDQLVADEQQLGAVGMAVVSDQASAIGVTAVPTPVTDNGSDLFYLHQWVMSEFIFISAAGFDSQGGRQYLIDSKAARKVNDDQDIVLVVENDNSISSGFQITVAGRFLIKEH